MRQYVSGLFRIDKNCCNYVKINLHTAFSQKQNIQRLVYNNISAVYHYYHACLFTTIINRFFSQVLDKS